MPRGPLAAAYGPDVVGSVLVLEEVLPARAEDRERQQGLARRPDLDLGAHLGADAAVEARGPPAVVDLGLVERVLPVLPEPVLVEAGVEVVPRQHLVLLALAGREPGDVDGLVGERRLGGPHPALV